MDISKMSNAEFFAHLMDFSNAGPMAQMIIVHAVDKYLNNGTPEPPQLGGLISVPAWLQACETLKEEFNQKYNDYLDKYSENKHFQRPLRDARFTT